MADSRLKRSVKRLANRLGYEIRHLGTTSDPAYEALHPLAMYSPWKTDEAFSRVFEIVRHQTLVDRYRCFDLWWLVGQTQHLEGSLLEVGVWRGGTGAVIATRASQDGNARVYLCDTFKGVVKASERDSMYRGGEHADAQRADVESLLARLGLSNVTILEGIFPDDTAGRIPPGPFRFCHVDVDVYDGAKQTTEWVWDRLVPGGVIVYDDYGFHGCDGVRAYVDEQRDRADRVTLYNLNGHATVVKIR
jgi:O-methyltransferase